MLKLERDWPLPLMQDLELLYKINTPLRPLHETHLVVVRGIIHQELLPKSVNEEAQLIVAATTVRSADLLSRNAKTWVRERERERQRKRQTETGTETERQRESNDMETVIYFF